MCTIFVINASTTVFVFRKKYRAFCIACHSFCLQNELFYLYQTLLQNPKTRAKLSAAERFCAALALHDLLQETSLAEVADRYDINKGALQSLQTSAATFAGEQNGYD